MTSVPTTLTTDPTRADCCPSPSAAANTGGPWLLSPRGELASAVVAGALLALGFSLERFAGIEAAVALVWASLAIGMVHGGRAAWAALRALTFDIDVLMVVGAGLAAAMGAPAEGALLLFLFVLAGALEELAMARTTRAVEALHKLMPTAALRLVRSNGTAAADDWETVSPEALVAGDVIKVLPGESIPADAVVAPDGGASSVDQANLTGESLPRAVGPGDELFAGTINVGDPLRATVTRPAAESSLQRILRLVTEAQQQREPVQRLIDRVSQPYAIGVLGVSVAVLLIWWLALGDSLAQATRTAITLLIVASPCAVIIATPTATLAAIARAARGGVLFKGGHAIERLARLGAVAFDKTGTLTVGRMRVRDLHPVGWSDESRLLAAAAGLEADSTHPIAAAVRAAAAERGVEPDRVENPRFTPGRGVSGDIAGAPARLGTLVFTTDLIPICLRARVQEVLASVQERGSIATVVAHDQQAGVIVLSDTVRPGAERLVERLHAMGVRPVVMLTGDNAATAKAVADSLGLDRFIAELLPEGKVAAVAGLKRELAASPAHRRGGRAVGVIGDGVNDAPALAAADVSIGIGSIGSDAALESADIVLLSDDLSVVPWALGLARRARRTIRFNLVFALAAIAIMAAATLIGSRTGRDVPLWLGVLGHEGGTLLVVFNSLLLLAARARAGGALRPFFTTEATESTELDEAMSS